MPKIRKLPQLPLRDHFKTPKYKVYKRRLDLYNRPDRWDVKRGDLVVVVKGSEKGKSGIVKKVIRRRNMLVVEGVNVRKRFVKTRGEKGRVVETPGKLRYFDVQLMDPKLKKPCKVVYRYSEEGEKVRVSTLSGQIIPTKDYERRPYEMNEACDTPANLAGEYTYREEEVIALKEKYLRELELKHYTQLKEEFLSQQKKAQHEEEVGNLFMHHVMQRAMEIRKEDRL